MQRHIDSPRRRPWLGLVTTLIIGCSPSLAAEPLEVHVEKAGDAVVVDVRATVNVPPSIAWDVLTDYDHMADFVSALKTSRVLSRSGNRLEVEQKGGAQFGFLHFDFSSVRAVDLTPQREIRSRLLRGDFERFDFTTRVETANGSTVIIHHGDYVPKRWVPPGVGPSIIASQTELQYRELIAEMLRRQGPKP